MPMVTIGGCCVQGATLELPLPPPLATALIPPSVTIENDAEYLRGCDDVAGDGSNIVPYLIRIVTNTSTGVSSAPTTHTLAGGAYAPVNPVACAGTQDLETLRTCFRLVADPTTMIWRTDIIDPVASAVLGTIWQDEAGSAIAAPGAGTIMPCDENADRIYTPRTSGLKTAPFAIPAPTAPARLRSFTLLVSANSTATITNGPDAGTQFPPGSYSWSAPVTAPGAERGYLSYFPAVAATLGSFMINWTEG